MWLTFFQGIALALPSIIVPSPLKIYLISRSLAHGWRATLPGALAPLVTDGPIVIATLLILNRIPPWYLNGLRLLGGLFVLYLAWRILRLLRAAGPTLSASAQAARQSFRQALGIQLLNPNPYLLWGLVGGPIVLAAWRQVSPPAGMSFVIGFYLVFVTGLVGLVFLFGTLGRLSAGANRLLNGLAAVALSLFGLYQIVIGLRGILGYG